MRRRFHWLKPIEQLHEGSIPNSIIGWHKYQVQEKRTLGLNGWSSSKYHYQLFIDLWVVKIQLGWVGREKPSKP